MFATHPSIFQSPSRTLFPFELVLHVAWFDEFKSRSCLSMPPNFDVGVRCDGADYVDSGVQHGVNLEFGLHVVSFTGDREMLRAVILPPYRSAYTSGGTASKHDRPSSWPSWFPPWFPHPLAVLLVGRGSVRGAPSPCPSPTVGRGSSVPGEVFASASLRLRTSALSRSPPLLGEPLCVFPSLR